MIILVINCGSSSIKYQLLDMRSDDVYDLMAKGIVEKIGLESGRLQHTPIGRDKVVKDLYIPDHTVGMQLVLDALVDKDYRSMIKVLDNIANKYYFTAINDLRKTDESLFGECTNINYQLFEISPRFTIPPTSWVSGHARKCCPMFPR